MALLLGGAQPQLLCSIRHGHRKPCIGASHRRFHFADNTTIRIVLSTPPFHPRHILFSPPKSASIDGISVQNNSEALGEDHNREEKEEDEEFLKRLRRWFSFLPSILPGGSWWDFSEDVEVQDLAKPVTVWRALGKMWQLVAHDRWVIVGAFSALILAAVRAA